MKHLKAYCQVFFHKKFNFSSTTRQINDLRNHPLSIDRLFINNSANTRPSATLIQGVFVTLNGLAILAKVSHFSRTDIDNISESLPFKIQISVKHLLKPL